MFHRRYLPFRGTTSGLTRLVRGRQRDNGARQGAEVGVATRASPVRSSDVPSPVFAVPRNNLGANPVGAGSTTGQRCEARGGGRRSDARVAGSFFRCSIAGICRSEEQPRG